MLARFLGDAQGAWRYRLRALETIPWHDPDHLHGYLITAAITASLHGYQRAALVYQSAAVENAASRGASAQAEAFLQRSRMHFRLGQMDEAAADLRDGEARLGLLADDDMRRRISVSWLTASAEVLRDADSARAVASAQEAIQLTDARRDLLRIAELNLYRGRALSKLGQADEARGALGDGIEAWERAVSSLDRHDPLRVSAIEPVWELFAEAALLALDAGDAEAAFSAVERGRATSILARWQQQPIALADARARLAPHQAVVIVTQNRTGLAVLTVRATGVEVTRMTMTAAAARAEVGAHLDEIQRAALDGPGTARLAVLMGPVLGKLEDATSVAIVADDPWSPVVWPALRLPTSQLAGERYQFVMAPSVSVALAVRPAPPAGGPLTVVVEPPPAEGFPSLPQASLEAKAVADSYPNSAVLVGAAAGASAVLDLMQRASVVHFAGHAVDVPAYPLMSHLIVSPSAPDPGGRLLARDIARANLAGADVVVLAACTTAGTRTSRGEGTVGVAWGFIAAGARQVVATRWPVDDAAAARFSIQFHQILSATGDAGMALQAVQRAMSKTESTASWLAPVLVGAL